MHNNILFLVTSSIDPTDNPFTYSPRRSFFNKEERLRQTIFTINSIRNTHPEADIILIDSSPNPEEFINAFDVFNNKFKFIAIKELDQNVFEIVNSHKNKSLCECLMLKTFIEKHYNFIKQYDYIIKHTARYFTANFHDNLTNYTLQKIFFKKPFVYEWDDSWQYDLVDRRQEQGDNKLYQYCTVLYGFHVTHLNKFLDIYTIAIDILNKEKYLHFDIETLMYFLLRPYKDSIEETDWIVSGWDGVSGRFMYY